MKYYFGNDILTIGKELFCKPDQSQAVLIREIFLAGLYSPEAVSFGEKHYTDKRDRLNLLMMLGCFPVDSVNDLLIRLKFPSMPPELDEESAKKISFNLLYRIALNHLPADLGKE